MRNKLNIKENWEKGLTLSKKEIGHIKAGDGMSDTWTQPNLVKRVTKTIPISTSG